MSNWVTLITFVYPHEAHLAKNILESEGITVFIQDELTVQVNNFLSNAVGGVKLQVPEEEAVQAFDILKEAGYIQEQQEKKEEKMESFSAEFRKVCPYCRSENVSGVKRHGLGSMLFSICLLIPSPFFRRSYHCFDCQKEWKVKS